MQRDFAGSFSDYKAWLATIRRTHERRIVVRVLDLEHNHLSNLSAKFLDGQITVDTSRDVSRVLDITFLDPTRSIQFEPNDPSGAPIHRSRMLQVGYVVKVPELGRWVECVVFTGPVWDFDRTGAEVKVVAHGKERLALGEAFSTRHFPKKTPKTNIIRAVLSDAGETRFAGLDLVGHTTPDKVTVGHMDQRWPKAKRIAASMNRLLFYTGTGRATLRLPSQKPVFTFDARTLLSEVSIDRNSEGMFNTWEVLGAKPKGAKTRILQRAVLPDPNAMSSKSLGRNGKRHYLISQDDDSHLKTKAAAHARAVQNRDDAARLISNYQFDSLPIPHLEEGDMVRVVTDEGVFLLRLKQFTLPLGIDGAPAMSVGSLKRARGARRRRGVIISGPGAR